MTVAKAWIAGVLLASLAVDTRLSAAAPTTMPAGDYWVEPMKLVHARFKGNKGRCALYGDSITYSMAFLGTAAWGNDIPYRNIPAHAQADLKAVWTHADRTFWQKRDPSLGQQGSTQSDWFLANVDAWQTKLKPEVCVILFGTNDLGRTNPQQYARNMDAAIRRILADGTIPIVTTVPPAAGRDAAVAQFHTELAAIVRRHNIPVIDYCAEILRRRPKDWNGTLPQHLATARGPDGRVDVYEVPAPISGDGVHPSNPKAYRGDFSDEALDNNGFNLRDYLTLRMYGQVIRKVLQ